MLLPTLKDDSNDSSESDPGTSRNATPSMSGKKKLPSNVTTTVSIIQFYHPWCPIYIYICHIYFYSN